ncbi:hypothetical protein CKAN_02459500 [Cinnamomum micranthum f. kanehirae]|uniref:Uncharacterized protein n=1 Tax=Cinnamomum micranthum f. kanehirae TaxID=337451 RepID=A0A3S3NMW4_9MAGN|nr:hypothetical protein CKAN_02459500 [Cinnamomum micranthum f. kanehirae]
MAVETFARVITTATVLECIVKVHRFIRWVAPHKTINAPNCISTHLFLYKINKLKRNGEISKGNKEVRQILIFHQKLISRPLWLNAVAGLHLP